MPEEERLRELLMDHLDLDERLLVRDLTFDELAADSLTLLELLTAIENTFHIDLEEEAFASCTNVGALYDLVMAKIRS